MYALTDRWTARIPVFADMGRGERDPQQCNNTPPPCNACACVPERASKIIRVLGNSQQLNHHQQRDAKQSRALALRARAQKPPPSRHAESLTRTFSDADMALTIQRSGEKSPLLATLMFCRTLTLSCSEHLTYLPVVTSPSRLLSSSVMGEGLEKVEDLTSSRIMRTCAPCPYSLVSIHADLAPTSQISVAVVVVLVVVNGEDEWGSQRPPV